jgi:ABC-2 type transport system permease protein
MNAPAIPTESVAPSTPSDAQRATSVASTSPAWIVFRRELASYFVTPLAYVFILIFLALAAGLTFQLGGLYERGQADLAPFFNFHPWLYLFLIPAISMRLWAEERKSGSIELLMTQPLTLWQAVLGKYFAAWVFAGIALALTFPLWITVNWLGAPDNGAIFTAYLGSLLMAGGFLAIGSLMSALTRNQVIAFILSVVACFGFLLAGFPLVLDAFRGWAPELLVDAIASLSFLTHFEALSKGVVDLRDVLYFALTIGFFLVATTIVLDVRKSE